MRVAVTGGNGFVGRELIKISKAFDIEIIPLVRYHNGLANEIIVGNLQEADVLNLAERLSNVQSVVHLAARTHVMRNGGGATAEYSATNVSGTDIIAQAAILAGIHKFVFASSIKVNGEQTFNGHIFSGRDTPAPEDDYGRTKLQAENLLFRLTTQTDMDLVILRPPLVYGAHVGGNFGRLVAAVRRGVPLPFGKLDNRRSLISVRNFAEAILCALRRCKVEDTILTLADGEDVSTRSLVQAIGQAIGQPARLVPVPVSAIQGVGGLLGKRDEVRRLTGDLRVETEQAVRQLSWKPSEQLHRALERMFKEPRP
ncbi:NAD-dependent epimerase/dehydratase family protein [Sphingomonas aestuarii]